MTFSYMPYWRATEAKVEGSSQRIQEDCMNFARIVESIGLQVIRALMLLIAFIPILYGLSSNVVIPWLKDINGSLVWVSLIASLGGVLISWLVGIKLPGLEYNNQVVEAAFRKELVYGEDDRIEYAKPPTILELFAGIKFNYHRLFLHYGYFDLWLIMYNQSMIIVPYIIMGPGLFTGVSLAVGKDEQGAAAGILVSAYAAGFVINPLTGMKLFDWNPDSPYFLGVILMILCLVISIIDKRLNIKVDFDEDMGHSGHTG